MKFSIVIFIFNILILLFKSQASETVAEPIVESQDIKDNNNQEDVINQKPEISEEEERIRNAEISFSMEWSITMTDYEPSYVYMIPVEKRSTQIFYETITKPAKVRGAFLISGESGKKEPIDFQINDPTNTIIYKNNTISGIFSFEANLFGEYSISIRNKSPKDLALVTFTMNTYQEEVLSKEHLSIAEEKLTNIMRFIRSIKAEEGFTRQFVRDKKKSKLILIIKISSLKK